MSESSDAAAKYLAALGYDNAWYRSSPDAEVQNINLDTLEVTPYMPPTVTQPLGQVVPPHQAIPQPQPPTGAPVGWGSDVWDWMKDTFGDPDPLGPIDDLFKVPGEFFGGMKSSIGGIMGILPLILMMGGKMDLKKIILLVLMGGMGGALGGLFGGGSSTGFGGSSGQLMSSHSNPFGGGSSIDPMMLMMLMGGSGSSNKMLTTMMMAPMLGIDPMSAMMLGQFTNTSSGRRRSSRRGYSAASRRSYSAGLNAGRTQGFIRSA